MLDRVRWLVYRCMQCVLYWLVTRAVFGMRVRCYCAALVQVAVAHRWVGNSATAPELPAPFGDNYLAEVFSGSRWLAGGLHSTVWHWVNICRCFAFNYQPTSTPSPELPICICMLATQNIHSYAKYAIEANRMYAARHGYGFTVFTESLDPDRHPSWHKILAMRRVLDDPRYSGAFWIDADAIVTDWETRIEQLWAGQDFSFTLDPPMFFNTLVNGGVWLCRDNEFCRGFLDRVWEAGTTEAAVVPYRQRHPWEQVLPPVPTHPDYCCRLRSIWS